MKRFLLAITLLGSGAILAGCPIYSDTGNYRVCTSSGCYDCPDTQLSSACILWQCSTDADCGGNGLVCSGNACVSGGVIVSGPDASSGVSTCYSDSDCSYGSWCSEGQCVSNDSVTFDAAAPGSDSGEGGALGTSEAGAIDGGDAAPQPMPSCNADGQCGGGGARCVNGQCTPQSGLCSDGTQCLSGESCVDGICTAQCAANNPCPIGFGCDLNRGVCSLNSTVCAINADCQGGTVCVESYCVAPCASADVGPACPNPNVEMCINGGCIPNQAATFSCTNDGGGTCSPATDAGSQCNPAAGSFCSAAGTLCIDGACK